MRDFASQMVGKEKQALQLAELSSSIGILPTNLFSSIRRSTKDLHFPSSRGIFPDSLLSERKIRQVS